MELKRRSFLAGIATAAAATIIPSKKAEAQTQNPGHKSFAALIDLTKCDGCPGKDTPACVSACKKGNAPRFPKPDKTKIKDYWPQKKHEDWSDKQQVTNRLTPYNWLFVQKVSVEGETVAVPRRCMHCDNPPCVKLCPFGVNKKLKEGPVYIEADLCFGGAKCRTVCPWNVPQRQAGVGVYTHLQPVPVGGGVMYKCDFCKDRLLSGKTPHCANACPKGAMTVGDKTQIIEQAKKLQIKYGGHLYGLEEHGGTSTIYVSKIPFDKIDNEIVKTAQKPKKAMRLHKPENMIKETSHLAEIALAAPLAGAATAFVVGALNSENKKQRKIDVKNHADSNSQASKLETPTLKESVHNPNNGDDNETK